MNNNNNNFFDWMNYWQKQVQPTNAGFGNNFFDPSQYQNMFANNVLSQWQEQQKSLFANMMPHNDLMGFWNGIMSRFSLKDVDYSSLFVNPYFTNLQEAFENQDIESQKNTLKEICKYWFEKSNFAFNQHLDLLTWCKQSLELFVERMQLNGLQDDLQKDTRAYFDALLAAYQGIIDLIRVFEGFDVELTDRFVEKCMDNNISFSDAEELFDTWCNLFDSCYNECVFGSAYQESFATFISTVSRLRKAQQKLTDCSVELFGLPSKREMDGVLSRLHGQQKTLRNLQKQQSNSQDSSQDLKAMQNEIEGLKKSLTQAEDKMQKLADDFSKLASAKQATAKTQASAPKSNARSKK